MSVTQDGHTVVAGATNRVSPYVSAGMLSELKGHVERSSFIPYEVRFSQESDKVAFAKQRMEVLKSIASIRASHETFRDALPSTRGRVLPHVNTTRRDTTCKPLYLTATTNRYKTIDDLRGTDGTQSDTALFLRSSQECDAPGSPLPAESPHVIPTTSEDPRKKVAEKHRVALLAPRLYLPKRVEESILSFSQTLGEVKPYATNRSAKLETRHNFANRNDMNARYVERMSCCRPSKGLYKYY